MHQSPDKPVISTESNQDYSRLKTNGFSENVGNFLSYSYNCYKNAINALRYVGITDIDNGRDAEVISDDGSSVKEVEIIEFDGRERRRIGDLDVKKVEEPNFQSSSSSVVAEVTNGGDVRVENAGKMLDSLLLGQEDVVDVEVYKKLSECAERRNSKLKGLGFEIELNENSAKKPEVDVLSVEVYNKWLDSGERRNPKLKGLGFEIEFNENRLPSLQSFHSVKKPEVDVISVEVHKKLLESAERRNYKLKGLGFEIELNGNSVKKPEVDVFSVEAYNKFLDSVERRNSKMKGLGFEIEFNEKRLPSLQLLQSVKKQEVDVISVEAYNKLLDSVKRRNSSLKGLGFEIEFNEKRLLSCSPS